MNKEQVINSRISHGTDGKSLAKQMLGKSTVHMTTDEIIELTRRDKEGLDTELLDALEDNDLVAIAKAREDQYEQAVEVKWDDL